MIEELDECIKMYENKDNAFARNNWYDFGYESVLGILSYFSDDDWKKLISILHSKSNDWKERLSYSLTFDENENYLKVLLSMINTKNVNIFTNIISYLEKYNCNVPEYLTTIVGKINYFLPEVDNEKCELFLKYLEKIKKEYYLYISDINMDKEYQKYDDKKYKQRHY